MGDLSDRCESLLFNELLSVVILVVHSKDGSQEIIPAHKFLLETRSDCFKSMFAGGLSNNSKEQDIHGVEPIGMAQGE